MPAAADKEIDRLYGLPLEQFTRARNEAAGRLKKQGEPDEAERLQKLPKPPVPLWAINQLARKERMLVRSLLTAAERLRKAHEGMLRGRSAEKVREAGDEERDVIRRLVQAAERMLRESGHSPTAATEDRIARTLRAAAVDETGRELLKRGRLTEELDPAGLGPALQGPPQARGTQARSKGRKTGATPKRGADEERRKRLEAQKRQRELRDTVRDAEKDVASARRELEARERALARARERLELLS